MKDCRLITTVAAFAALRLAGFGQVADRAIAPGPRDAEKVLTTMNQFWTLPEEEKAQRHRVSLDVVVFYRDPYWKFVFCRSGDDVDYLTLGDTAFPLKPGQRIRIEGSMVPTKGTIVDDAKITLLAEGEPLEELVTTGRIGDVARFSKRQVLAEGVVDRQITNDENHDELTLITEGRPLIVHLQHAAAVPVAALEGALVRLRGLYSATADPGGGAPTIEIWVQQPQAVEVLGWLDRDSRFDRPLTAIDQIAAAGRDALVRVKGIVRAQQPRKSLTIRDESGQITLSTAQSRTVPLGDTVEVIGYPVIRHGEATLQECLYRPSAGALSGAAWRATLRLAEQLRELQPDEASRGYPVKLTGIVTWVHRDADFFFIRDASGGVRVLRPPGSNELVRLGAKIEVVGTSASGQFTPEVQATGLRSDAVVDPPEAKSVLLEQVLTGVEEAEWVTMSGFVRDLAVEGAWVRLDLTTPAGEFSALVPPDGRLEGLRESVVRVRGVCTAVANGRRQLTGIRLWVPSIEYFETEEARPANVFGIPVRAIASLRQFGSQQAFNRRVRVAGVVTHQTTGRLVHIQEGTDALLVLSRDTATPLTPGDRIEAVGFPGRENSRLVLREAVYRRIEGSERPATLPRKTLSPIETEIDGLLVQTEGTLLDIGAQDGGVRLLLQADDSVFEALLEQHGPSSPARWEKGSRLALTGVYITRFDEYHRPKSVQIQLRTPQDVRILHDAPLWTFRRMLTIIGLLGSGLVLGFAWVFVLRRRVRTQTQQLRAQLEREKAARSEASLLRTSKLESLGLLAGGIAHDFNNLLTVIMGNLSLARLDERCPDDVRQGLLDSEKAAVRARELTQQLLTFSKGGAPIRASANLPEILQEAAKFALHGSKVGCEFDLPANLWPAFVDRGQIVQVAQNIIINASHAMPQGGTVRVSLRNDEIAPDARPDLAAGRYLRIAISDTGQGIPPEVLPRIFEPYFTTKRKGTGLGLATTHSIVKQHSGHIEVESTLGRGTTFHVWLPAADTPPAPAAETVDPLPLEQGRVLFMDDEEQIRTMAGVILKRIGLEVTAVEDGRGVLSEYAAARDAGKPYDLVILDLTVPGGMGGAEAIERLREMDPNVRVIASSGYSSNPVLANHRAYGFSGIVPKPYVVTEVAKVVAAVLRTRGP